MTSLYDLDRDQLAAHLEGEPGYRLDQLWDGLYGRALLPEEVSNLPRALRDRLSAELPCALRPVTESVSDAGETVKFLWELADGATVETVLMHYLREGGAGDEDRDGGVGRDGDGDGDGDGEGVADVAPGGRTTVCVSSQAGCAMGCTFCATGQAGFERHLGTGEIVEQVIRAQRRASLHPDGPRRVSNIVFMGMGEPLANLDPVLRAVRRIRDDIGIGARRITVSTVGVVPGIRRLAEAGLPVNLAVSLHAADDRLRNRLVPLNRRWPLAELMAACHQWYGDTGRRVSFEWALISGVNDRYEDADRLARLAAPLRAHVNLIPLNPTPGYPVRGSSGNRVHAFRDRLVAAGIVTTIRDTRGSDIDAACGQLRAGHEATPVSGPGRR